MTKYEEFKGKSLVELKSELADLKRELMNLRFQQASGELENTARFKEVRRDIARISTAINVLNNSEAA